MNVKTHENMMEMVKFIELIFNSMMGYLRDVAVSEFGYSFIIESKAQMGFEFQFMGSATDGYNNLLLRIRRDDETKEEIFDVGFYTKNPGEDILMAIHGILLIAGIPVHKWDWLNLTPNQYDEGEEYCE